MTQPLLCVLRVNDYYYMIFGSLTPNARPTMLAKKDCYTSPCNMNEHRNNNGF